jgi:GntR family transcriptional regulator, transcriptional repressor for pyruvate dehydrogenase complex
MSDRSNGTDDVIQRLVDYVLTEKLSPGDPLPSVRDLSQRWNLGRNLVRDGLLRAQVLSLVEVRPRSGVILRAVDYELLVGTLSQTLGVAMWQRDPNLLHIWQARTIIEIETASGAARRRLPEDLHRLRGLLVEMKRVRSDRQKLVEADERFHLTIAEIAGNPVLRILLDVLLKIMRPARVNSRPLDTPEQTASTHDAIYNAIAHGDGQQASTIMREHCSPRVTTTMDWNASL